RVVRVAVDGDEDEMRDAGDAVQSRRELAGLLEVERDAARGAADLAGDRLGRGLVAAGQHHFAPLLREHPGDLAADAARAPDDDDAALGHRPTPLRRMCAGTVHSADLRLIAWQTGRAHAAR